MVRPCSSVKKIWALGNYSLFLGAQLLFRHLCKKRNLLRRLWETNVHVQLPNLRGVKRVIIVNPKCRFFERCNDKRASAKQDRGRSTTFKRWRESTRFSCKATGQGNHIRKAAQATMILFLPQNFIVLSDTHPSCCKTRRVRWKSFLRIWGGKFCGLYPICRLCNRSNSLGFLQGTSCLKFLE